MADTYWVKVQFQAEFATSGTRDTHYNAIKTALDNATGAATSKKGRVQKYDLVETTSPILDRQNEAETEY